MAALIGAVNNKMGGGANPMSAMLMGMMPYIRTKIDEIDEKTLSHLANVMAQAFEKVSDPAVSESEFTEWLKLE
jgi:hypothetical protein